LKRNAVKGDVRGIVSPPARGRGLKQMNECAARVKESVAPRAGAWIETKRSRSHTFKPTSRPPRGGVD